ncbi:MAG: hypothetical protein CMI59_14275 [Parvibaculum sp.]|nr:hypothetical protein [Parvibaculum sp.]
MLSLSGSSWKGLPVGEPVDFCLQDLGSLPVTKQDNGKDFGGIFGGQLENIFPVGIVSVEKAMNETLGACKDGITAWQDEMKRFTEQRMEVAKDAFDQLREAKSPTDAVKVQNKYLTDAATAYLEEMRTLGEIWQKMANDNLEALTEMTPTEDAKDSSKKASAAAGQQAAAE